ncbi:thioredoxin [Rhizobium hidalgonense]|nr:thioredoxin domain-containing protein [Rhizobium hidalgonense]RWX05675.1 thioredoxin [Rhizobium hidalgonense]
MPQSAKTSVKAVNATNFDLEVVESTKIVLVAFSSPGCTPCKAIAPILEEIAGEMKGIIKVVTLNVDEDPELRVQFGVRPIPTLKIFDSGKVAGTFIGAKPKSVIVDWIYQTIADWS